MQEGFWLPLAAEIAELSEDDAEDAADRLVHSSLLRVVDRERQRFQMHALLRDEVRATQRDDGLGKLQERHAAALERLFKDWETRWQECGECFDELTAALHFLIEAGADDRFLALADNGYRATFRTGDFQVALEVARIQERFWERPTKTRGEETVPALQVQASIAIRSQDWKAAADALRRGVAVDPTNALLAAALRGVEFEQRLADNYVHARHSLALRKNQECLEYLRLIQQWSPHYRDVETLVADLAPDASKDSKAESEQSAKRKESRSRTVKGPRRKGTAGARLSKKIFLSYRHDDTTSGYGLGLYSALKTWFPGRVFMDIEIEPGEDFRLAVHDRLETCVVLIALIGKVWLSVADPEGQRRLEDPSDLLRIEIATALQRNIRVIPFVVDNARMPAAEELPEDLKPLAYKLAVFAGRSNWDQECERVKRSIAQLIGRPKKLRS